MAQVINARPNGNYNHIVDVWNEGSINQDNRFRLLRLRYVCYPNVSGSNGSWCGPRRFSAWMDGADYPRDLNFDTRNGQSFTIVDISQWVYAGDGREIQVHAYFEGWSSSFPGFHDTGGRFWVDRVDPAVPPYGTPTAPRWTAISSLGHTGFGLNYDLPNGDGGNSVKQYQVIWRRVRDGVDVWNDMNSWGYTSPLAGAGPRLELGTEYDVFVRARNDAGWGPWSTNYRARTLAGSRVRYNGAWAWAIPHAKDGSWKQAIPFVRRSGVWKDGR